MRTDHVGLRNSIFQMHASCTEDKDFQNSIKMGMDHEQFLVPNKTEMIIEKRKKKSAYSSVHQRHKFLH